VLQQIGSPEKIIRGFAPELYKEPLEDDAILEQFTEEHGGLLYYYWYEASFPEGGGALSG
jgi:hypothetical protein